MNLNGFMNTTYKKVMPVVEILFALFLAIGAHIGISGYKKAVSTPSALDSLNQLGSMLGGDTAVATTAKSSGDTGGATFVQVMIWIMVSIFIICKACEIMQAIGLNPDFGAMKAAATAQNTQYAQPAQPVAQPVQQNAAAPAAGEKFCTQCGAKVPAGNGFCTSCGAKMD